MQLIVKGLATNFTRIGKGKLVVILPGWGDSSAGWLQFSKSLAAHFDVIAIDLPGFGGTEPPRDAWGVSDYAAFVAAFLEKANLKPYAYIGHSNGGAIAVRGIGSKTLQADKLVLLASAGIRGEYGGRNKVLRLVTKSGKLLVSPLPASVKNRLRHKVYETVGSDMLIAEHLQETFKRVVSDDVRGSATSVDLPTLLVYGKEDKATPPRYGKLLQDAIPGSELKILPDTGHFLHIDKPKEVEDAVVDFLK